MSFIHIRAKDKDGNVLNKGGKTVFYKTQDGTAFYSVAECSRKDMFCRRIGRDVARGRFDSGMFDTIRVDNQNPVEVILGVL